MRDTRGINKDIISAGFATAAFAVLLIAACNPYSPDLGERPFRCGTSEPFCPDGYECIESSPTERFCEKASAADRPDARPGQSDSGPFVCGADAELEPNDSITDPTVTPIPDFGDDYELIGLQICPSTDVDVFRFRVDVTGKNATVTLTYNSAAGELALDILNSTGVSIRAGSPTANPDIVNASVQNLPSGTYYAQVRALGTGVENDYDIEFVVTN